MIYSVLKKIKKPVGILMWIVIFTGLLVVTGVYTYSRYTYHYKATITVTVPATECSTLGMTLSDCVIAYGGNSFDIETAKAAIEAKGTPTFSTATTDKGMYSATDDYGTSYYYRGATTNNYVKYAGKIWRIIRVNGDGSVRMILNSNYTTTAFNTWYSTNAMVGYMYGDVYTDSGKSSSTTTKTLQSYYYYYSDSYTFDETTGFTLTNPTQQVWNSSLDGYYTCKSDTATTCTTMYKVSYYSTYQAKYYTYQATGTAGSYEESIGDTLSSAQTFATRYYYGTDYVFDPGTGYRLVGYTYNVYDGDGVVSDLTGYYTCGSTSYAGCSTLYYIDSASSTTTANVYTYTRSTSASTYDETHANTNDSTIKTVVDGFYKDYIKDETDDEGNSLEDYLSDTLFCNDRSYYSGTGIVTTTTYYNGRDRLYTNKSPVLTCTNQNDEFTVETTTLDDGTKVGNGDLTYPIGLITADEVAMAGGFYNTTNKYYYLYTGSYFWTMTPYSFDGTSAFEFYVYSTGSLYYNLVTYTHIGARPVVNLSSEVLVASGTGTSSDPYVVTLAS